jgi:hypothetical protein
VVTVGRHRASTRVQEKTLHPRWNETFVFDRLDIHDALEGACARRPACPMGLLPACLPACLGGRLPASLPACLPG